MREEEDNSSYFSISVEETVTTVNIYPSCAILNCR